MWPFFCMVGFPAMFAFSEKSLKVNFRTKHIVLGSFFLIWLLLLCLRNESVGVDVEHYKNWYLSLQYSSFDKIREGNFEIGFCALGKLLSLIGIDFRGFLIINAVLSVVPVYLLYRKNITYNPYLAIVMFLCIGLFTMYFSGLRQILSMAFVAPAYKFTKEKKIIPFIVIVALAVLFHNSGFVLLFMYPVYHVRIKAFNSFIIYAFVIVVFYVFKAPIFEFLCSLISDYYSYSTTQTGAVSIFIMLLLFVAYSFFIPDSGSMDDEAFGLRNVLVFSTILQIFAGINLLAMRFNYYYIILVPVAFLKISEYSKDEYKKLVQLAQLVMICYFTFYYFYKAYTGSNTLHVYPYEPFWSDVL